MSDMQPGPGAATPPYAAQSYAVSTFSEAIRVFFAKYVTFSGRANRPEYWYSALFILIVNIASAVIDVALFGVELDFSPVSSIASLALFLPSLSVSVRRLHDIDRTGWWLLLALVPILGWIVLIVFACQKGTEGANRFG